MRHTHLLRTLSHIYPILVVTQLSLGYVGALEAHIVESRDCDFHKCHFLAICVIHGICPRLDISYKLFQREHSHFLGID